METMVEFVLGTKKVCCQVYGKFERSTYLAMPQDPVVPLNVSTPTPQDATPLANKNVNNFLRDSVAGEQGPQMGEGFLTKLADRHATRLSYVVGKEKPTPVLFGTAGRLKRTRCGSIALGEFHMMDDFGGGYSEQAWSGQVLFSGSPSMELPVSQGLVSLEIPKENTSHGTPVLGAARVGREYT
ncbi:hypothetical protein N7519_005085 [Penicillium mononematosum]|uniref:uncharacterized protein n=1 Tax=Penicillium mononematosum TaxID=268346 RepID=UPI002546D3FF|nr:uncharacterized protein N7519_005085 [Penicillium mononematosum]KAJ6183784.1 hypothetical protein N7519_005085 [Penicillium mononematosum]